MTDTILFIIGTFISIITIAAVLQVGRSEAAMREQKKRDDKAVRASRSSAA